MWLITPSHAHATLPRSGTEARRRLRPLRAEPEPSLPPRLASALSYGARLAVALVLQECLLGGSGLLGLPPLAGRAGAVLVVSDPAVSVSMVLVSELASTARCYMRFRSFCSAIGQGMCRGKAGTVAFPTCPLPSYVLTTNNAFLSLIAR